MHKNFAISVICLLIIFSLLNCSGGAKRQAEIKKKYDPICKQVESCDSQMKELEKQKPGSAIEFCRNTFSALDENQPAAAVHVQICLVNQRTQGCDSVSIAGCITETVATMKKSSEK